MLKSESCSSFFGRRIVFSSNGRRKPPPSRQDLATPLPRRIISEIKKPQRRKPQQTLADLTQIILTLSARHIEPPSRSRQKLPGKTCRNGQKMPARKPTRRTEIGWPKRKERIAPSRRKNSPADGGKQERQNQKSPYDSAALRAPLNYASLHESGRPTTIPP